MHPPPPRRSPRATTLADPDPDTRTLNEALELNERYGKRLEEIIASQQAKN
jgi:hypothetical protein